MSAALARAEITEIRVFFERYGHRDLWPSEQRRLLTTLDQRDVVIRDLIRSYERYLGSSACGECAELGRTPCVNCDARQSIEQARKVLVG